MTHEKPRCGVLAVPESFRKKSTVKEARASLEAFYEAQKLGDKTSVMVGVDETILLYVFTNEDIEIPDTWLGYPVDVRDFGGPLEARG